MVKFVSLLAFLFCPACAHLTTGNRVPSAASAFLPDAGSPGLVAPRSAFIYGYTWKSCEQNGPYNPYLFGNNAKLYGAAYPIDVNHRPIEECLPNTLYIWVSETLAQNMIRKAQQSTSGTSPFFNAQFFLFRTPLGSFGYGNQQIRIKLKKGVTFAEADGRNRYCHSGEFKSNVVRVVHLVALPGYVEYVLCSDEPVESWSTATPEAYQEMMAEETWVENHQNGEYDGMVKNFNQPPEQSKLGDCPSCGPFKYKIDDPGTDWSIEHFTSNLINAKQRLELKPTGYVFDSSSSQADEKAHFSTSQPSYVNPLPEH